jgi:hypothetical protein
MSRIEKNQKLFIIEEFGENSRLGREIRQEKSGFLRRSRGKLGNANNP